MIRVLASIAYFLLLPVVLIIVAISGYRVFVESFLNEYNEEFS